MQLKHFVILPGIVLVFCAQYGDGTLMLTSLLMAAQTGMMLGKMSVGGLLMMLMAAQNQAPYGSKRSAGPYPGGLGGLGLGIGGSHAHSTSRRYKREAEPELNQTEETVVRERLVRQIDSAFDTLTCLPKFVCGLNASPPSKKTSLLNDYGHLLKLMLTDDTASTSPDADDDIDDSEQDDDPEPKTDEEYRLALKEKNKLKDMAHEEMLEEDPGMLSYVLKDVVQEMNNKKNPNRQSPGMTSFERPYADSDSDSEESPSSPNSYSPLQKIVSAFRLPSFKIKSSGTTDTTFDKDPFFEGFKRSLRGLQFRPIHDSVRDDQFFSRAEQAAFMRQKEKELEQVKDPVQKYKIAEDIGRKTKSQQDCAAAFKKCPYEWSQVMSMVNNLRDNVLSRPGSTQTSNFGSAEKVVFVKTSNGQVGTGNPLNLNNEDGITTVTHDLGNGNTVEISMKLFKLHKNKSPSRNKTEFQDDDEHESEVAIKPEVPMLFENAPTPVVNLHDVIDDEFGENPDEIDSAMKIFQAINSGQLPPLKKKNQTSIVLEAEAQTGSGSKENDEPERVVVKNDKSKRKYKPKIKVSDEDKSVTVTLAQDNDKKAKDKESKPDDTSEEDDDELEYEDLIPVLGFRRDRIRPGAHLTKIRTKDTPVPSTQESPSMQVPTLITRRRYPGTTRINLPRIKYHRSFPEAPVSVEVPEVMVVTI